jgi:hypothetical protein
MKPIVKFCTVFYNEFDQDPRTGAIQRKSNSLPIELSFDKLMGEDYITNKLYSLPEFNFLWQRVRSTYIARGRNALVNGMRSERVKQTLTESYTHYLFVDSDISFDKSHVVKLLSHNVDIVSGSYVERKSQDHYCAGKFVDPPDLGQFISREIKGLTNIDWVGAGFLLIKKEVFESLSYPWFQFVEVKYKDKEGIECVNEQPEDMSFCRKARNFGYQVWLDCDCVVSHHISNKTIVPSVYNLLNNYLNKGVTNG